MTSDAPNDELRELLEAFCRDELTTEQETRLQELVLDSEENRKFYVRYLHMHICLRRVFEKTVADVLLDQPTLLPLPGDHTPEARKGKNGSASLRGLFGSWRILGVLAASILMLLGGGLTWWLVDRGNPAAAARTVGVLTNAAGCAWQGTQTPVPGAKLQPGRLELDAGMAEITCTNGAVVLIEAPAVLELFDTSHGFLHAGRIVIRVPPEASGFVLDTHKARLLDIGTEFGVEVGNSGDTLVQVFDGIVVANLKQDKTPSPSQRLTAGQTVQISGDAEPRPQVSTSERFIRRFPFAAEHEWRWLAPYNERRYDRVHIVPAPQGVTIDGDLSDWDRSGQFSVACAEPYAKNYNVQGCLMYDRQFLYVGAHVADPSPMCSVIDPEIDPRVGWKGGGVQVRLSTDRAFGWPLAGQWPNFIKIDENFRPHPQDRSDHLVHLTMWYCKPKGQACLFLEYGMDIHGGRVNPAGFHGAFRKDSDGRGYTMEYAIPWDLLSAGDDPPRAGDVLGACWEVNWSDEEGRLWRGKLVDILNPKEKGVSYFRAATWGKAIYHPTGRLPPGSVAPLSRMSLPPHSPSGQQE